MTLRPARELAQQLANNSGLSFDARSDAIAAAIEADRREVVEACAKLCDVSQETFCPDVAPGELFVGGAALARVRILKLAIAKEKTT